MGKKLDIIVLKRRLSEYIAEDVLNEMDEETLRGTYEGLMLNVKYPEDELD